MRFRCDDISVNTDIAKLTAMTEILFSHFDCEVIYGISPCVNDMSGSSGLSKERIFPKIFNAYSDFRVFYSVDKVGVPVISDKQVKLAGHGIVHVDHRLLTRECQEMSIIVSSSIVKSKIFIPPFNKWNQDTQDICNEQQIELIRWEDGWKHLSYHKVDKDGLYYFHTHDFELEDFKKCITS